MDISADLEELGQTPVMVVCAGAKSILDLGLTLEYLETKGVPVIGYGTEELPAFYTRKSGFGVDYRLDTPAGLAAAVAARVVFPKEIREELHEEMEELRELGHHGGHTENKDAPGQGDKEG